MNGETKIGNLQTPCSDYEETHGVMFFARMLDKIRLHARGLLPAEYNLGYADPTSFDARFCRFWEIDYEEARVQALAGTSNEEALAFCFRHRKWPNAEQVLVWNNFLIKRGWRDEGAPGLEVEKDKLGEAARAVRTWVDLHDVDEGRAPRFSER